MKLNPQQQQAVDDIHSHLLVLAGAGSGKTRVITTKIGSLIVRHGVSAKNIVALTFTNKAAREMQQRLGSIIGSQARGLSISTFHSLGLKIIRQECEALGFKPNFSIFDSNDAARVLRELLREGNEGFNGDEDALKWELSALKNDNILPQAALDAAQTGNQIAVAKLYARYQRQLVAYNAFDFDDLITAPLNLLQQNPEVRQRWQARIRHLLVDEYQDTNASQYQLIKVLLGAYGKLTAVGDDDQSIYAWRGADIANISRLMSDFAHLKVIKLEQNYRSQQRILTCANQLIAHNPHEHQKKLWSDIGSGDKVSIIPCKNERAEAERVVSEIIRLTVMKDIAKKDIAVLYRSNFQSRPVAETLRSHAIAYKMSGGQDFFQLTEIKDTLAYLRLIVNPDDDAALLRIINTPRRELGAVSLEGLAKCATALGVGLLSAAGSYELAEYVKSRPAKLLAQFAKDIATLHLFSQKNPPQAVLRLLEETIQYQTWLQESVKNPEQIKRKQANLDELGNWIDRMVRKSPSGLNLSEVIAKITLLDILEGNEEEQAEDAIHLMTLHAAKGLEFAYVFLIGVEEDILPHHNSIIEDKIDEERRLCYVGITRAKVGLTLTYANTRNKAGEPNPTEPSRFLKELPESELNWHGKANQEPAVSREQADEYFALMRKILAK